MWSFSRLFLLWFSLLSFSGFSWKSSIFVLRHCTFSITGSCSLRVHVNCNKTINNNLIHFASTKMTRFYNRQSSSNGRQKLDPRAHRCTVEQSLYQDTWQVMHYLKSLKKTNNKRVSSHPKLWFRVKHTLPKEMSIVKKERSGIYPMGTSGYFPGK